MFSKSSVEAASRRAVRTFTVAVIGMAGLSFAASAQSLTGQEAAPPAPVSEAAPTPLAAPAPTSVRQAVTEVVQKQAADVTPGADAPPADAAPTDAAPAQNAAPVIKQGQRRVVVSQPAQPAYKAPVYGHRHAYAPHHVQRHVVHPQHFGYRHVQHGYAMRSYSNHGSYGFQAYGHGYRVTSGYNGYSRH